MLAGLENVEHFRYFHAVAHVDGHVRNGAACVACDGLPQADFRLVSVGAEAGGRERAYADRRRGHGREFPAGDVVAVVSGVNVFHLFFSCLRFASPLCVLFLAV